ncbi:MAG TPA: glycosyltransferase family 39 protein, partial [bacterium]|nr:glycosyltransferase family 39 protein [bacterium]
MNRKISALSFLGRPEFILLFLILLAGGALRFSRLDFQSLAGDELQTWLIVSGSKNLQDIWTNAKHDTLPPGYNLLLHPFVGIFGDSEKALRSLSAASGFASILILFFLGKLIFSFREGLISCALLSFSLFGIYYSQESRPYSLLLTGTLLTAFFSFELIKHIDKDSGIPLSAAAGYV